MNKLSLNLDDLSVDSFQTGTAAPTGGTVNGQALEPVGPVKPIDTFDVACFSDVVNTCTWESELFTACCDTWEMGSNCGYESQFEPCIVDDSPIQQA